MSKRVRQIVGYTTAWLILFFGAAGRLDWTRGWIFVALYVIGMGLIGVVVKRANPDLVEARAKWRRKDTKPFDKVFLAIFVPLSTIHPAIGALDVARFGWSDMAGWWMWVGIVMFIPGMALMAWSMVANRHAETTVRIQTDRDHKVVTQGPYRFVRHPMYVGAIVMYFASALILGSEWALWTAGVILVSLVWRTALEDRTLRRELTGYEEFARQTRYRLVPGVW
jgi:protein-S-isoprenylcysteine O-methyltransferase Ste14